MPKIKWNLEKVREGFKKFHEEYGRYPTSNEIDDFKHLPSARQIQRSLGGLVSLRKEIGLSVENYSSGEERSKISTDLGKRGKNCEYLVYDFLKGIFKESFVHVERPISICSDMNSEDWGRNRFDFYVYAKPNNFAVDVFGTRDFRCFLKVMNIKEGKYKMTKKMKRGEWLYFVYFSDFNLKDRINLWLSRKRELMPANWKILNFDEFKEEIRSYKSF
ncbi:MAG: hypothetical protein V1804_03765 [Patescibacteria group bacterium]